MIKNKFGTIVLILIATLFAQVVSAKPSRPIDNPINNPPGEVIDEPQPPTERPSNPSLSAFAGKTSDPSLVVTYTCGKGFNTLFRRISSQSREKRIPVEPCKIGRLNDFDIEPATEYCYRLEAVDKKGRRNTESCATARPGKNAPPDPVNHWQPVDTLSSSASPAISGHADGRMYIAAVNGGGELRFSTSAKPGVWSTWQSISSPPTDGFHRETAPILHRVENTLHAYARGSDNNLYHSQKTGSSNSSWSGWNVVIDDNSVRGRFLIASTGGSGVSTNHHLIYQTSEGTRYVRMSSSGILNLKDWPKAVEGVVAGNGKDEITVALRYEEKIVFETAKQASGWEFDKAKSLSRDIFELSNLVFYKQAYHVVFSTRELLDDVSFSYQYRLRHAWFEPDNDSIGIRNVDTYDERGSIHPRPALLAYRNKLISAWNNPHGKILNARWDNSDPLLPWVEGGSLGGGWSSYRPALTSFDRRPYITNPEYASGNYGNDAYAVSTGKQGNSRIKFLVMSRAIMRKDMQAEFTLYNSRSDTLDPVCRTPSATNGPVKVKNLWDEERPVLSEIGYNIWMFPHWLIEHLYSNFTVFMCGTDGPWGAESTPCLEKKLPIYLKEKGGIFNCGGAWINQDDKHIRIWEELGHYFSPALGFGTVMSPTEETATRTGIALDELQDGHSLFKAETGSCQTASPRCTGFTGIGGNYDVDGIEHSFIYVIYFYLNRGDELRTFIQEDLAKDSSLLLNKYDWVKNNIFNGVEFRGDGEPLN